MNIFSYLKDRFPILLLHGSGIFLLSSFLLLVGNSAGIVLLVDCSWLGVLFIWLAADTFRRHRYFSELLDLTEALDDPYLLPEVMPRPERLEDRIYHELLHKTSRSMIEKIHQLENGRREYKDYIESWVHEIKTPITAARLICQNHRSEETRRILAQLSQIENQVEMVLYYARMEQANRDYRIHSITLKEPVLSAIHGEKEHFLLCNMSIDFCPDDTVVETDEKWLDFLLRQFFSNSRKYRRENNPRLTIYARENAGSVSLILEDNGMGIPSQDLERIFDKGFTGENGRKRQGSTGMGLYLCRGLCEKLGISLRCESIFGEYTRMILTFPHTDFQKILQK